MGSLASGMTGADNYHIEIKSHIQILINGIEHSKGFVFGSLHYLAFARTLIIDAAKVEHPVNNNSIKLPYIFISKLLSITANRIERNKHVATQKATDTIVESNDIRKVMMIKILGVNFKNLRIIAKDIIKRAHLSIVNIGDLDDPSLKPFIIKFGEWNTRS